MMKNVGGSECVTANSTPVNRLRLDMRGVRQTKTPIISHLLEFFGFVRQSLPGVHGLHPQNLVVALFVIEHRMREVIEDILRC